MISCGYLGDDGISVTDMCVGITGVVAAANCCLEYFTSESELEVDSAAFSEMTTKKTHKTQCSFCPTDIVMNKYCTKL